MTNKKVPEQKAMAKAFIKWLKATDSYGNTYAMARRLGVEYIIWNNRMWRTYDPGRGSTEYSDCLHKKKKGKAAYANACHRTHVHISLSWDGAYKRTSYFSGYVACPAFHQQPTTAARPPERLCRSRGAHPGHESRHGYADRAVPGARWLALRPDPSWVRAGCRRRVWPRSCCTSTSSRLTRRRACRSGRPGGTPTPAVASATTGSANALVTVPVGSNGMVSLQHSAGMSHVVADVVGYYPTASCLRTC